MYQLRRSDSRTFLLHVDSYENGVMTGRYYSPQLQESGEFSSLSQLLLKLDRCLDINNVPQAFQSARHFSPLISMWDAAPSEPCTQPGKRENFVIQILFRRNSSWQGSICWLEQEQTLHFRSALELIGMLDNALSSHSHPLRSSKQQRLNLAADS